MRKIIILFCLLFCILYRQEMPAQTICGTVFDENNTALPQARIILTLGQDSILATSYSSDDGNWCISSDSITLGSVSPLFITFYYIGYDKKSINTDSLLSYKNIKIKLFPYDYRLKEITIAEKRKYIEIHGDTLEYNAEDYRSNTDRNMSDLLRKMEGIEISGQGDIMYNSRRIDKLLIEGKDILNDQHKLALEMLDPLKIKKIHVIRNYKSFHEKFLDKFSPKIAMNFLLKDNAKKKINGKIQLGAGYKNKYDANINLYSVYDSLGFTSSAKSNNTGEQIITYNDFLNMESDLLRAINKANGDFSNLLPVEFIRKETEQKETAHLLAINFEKDVSDKITNNISFLSNYFDRKGKFDLQRIFTYDNTAISGIKKNTNKSPFIFFTVDRKISFDKKNNLEIEIPLKYKNGVFEENIEGKKDSSLLDNIWTKNSNEFSIFPNLYYSAKLDDKHIIKLETNVDVNIKNENNRINSTVSVFDTDTTGIYQLSNMRNVDFRLKGLWLYKNKNWRFYTSFLFNSISNKLKLNDNLIDNKPDYHFSSLSKNLTPQIKIIYKRNKLLFTVKSSYPYSKVHAGNEFYTTGFNNSSFNFKYTFNQIHFFLLKINSSHTAYDPLLNLQEYLIVDSYTLKKNAVNDIKKNMDSKNIAISYFNLRPSTGLKIYTIFKYGLQKNSLFSIYENKNNYILQLIKPAKTSNNIDFQSSLQKMYFNRRLRGNIDFRWQHTENESDKKYILESKKINLTFSTNFKKKFNGAIKFSASSFTQNIAQSNVEFQTYGLFIDLKYSYKRTNGYINAIYNIRKTEKYSSNFTILNLGFDHEILPKTFIFFKAKDVLNLSGQIVQNSHFYNSFIDLESYQRFPGSLIIGIKKGF